MVQGGSLTGHAISRLRAVLRVPVNIQESNCLKHNSVQFTIILHFSLFDMMYSSLGNQTSKNENNFK